MRRLLAWLRLGSVKSRYLFRADTGAANSGRERPRPVADEREDPAHQLVVRAFLLDLRQQVSIGRAQAQYFRSGKAAPSQANHIDADKVCERPLRHAPRNDVGANAAHSYDHCALPDPNELTHRSLAAQKTVV